MTNQDVAAPSDDSVRSDDLIMPSQLKKAAEDRELSKAREARQRLEKEEAQRKEFRDAFMEREIHPEAKRRLSRIVRKAAENGEHEVLVFQFPADLCEDGGIAINNQHADWPETLQGFARRAYEFFKQELEPHGYRIRVQILSYPNHMLGDVGVFLSW